MTDWSVQTIFGQDVETDVHTCRRCGQAFEWLKGPLTQEVDLMGANCPTCNEAMFRELMTA